MAANFCKNVKNVFFSLFWLQKNFYQPILAAKIFRFLTIFSKKIFLAKNGQKRPKNGHFLAIFGHFLALFWPFFDKKLQKFLIFSKKFLFFQKVVKFRKILVIFLKF